MIFSVLDCTVSKFSVLFLGNYSRKYGQGLTKSITIIFPHSFHYILLCDDADIDECAVNNGGCSSDATCTNTPGSFTCTCLTGYSGDGFNCTGKIDLNLVELIKYSRRLRLFVTFF